MKKFIAIAMLLMMTAAFCSAQNSYGKVRYRQIKNDYNRKEYVSTPYDKYSRGWAAVGSAVIPGLGQALDGEWGRAAGFFFGDIALRTMTALSVSSETDTQGNTTYEATPYFWGFLAADLALNIWSIIDAVHVAQVKNMCLQDRAGIDFDLLPYYAYNPHIAGGVPVTGISMRLSF